MVNIGQWLREYFCESLMYGHDMVKTYNSTNLETEMCLHCGYTESWMIIPEPTMSDWSVTLDVKVKDIQLKGKSVINKTQVKKK